jgi:hypothetical protein
MLWENRKEDFSCEFGRRQCRASPAIRRHALYEPARRNFRQPWLLGRDRDADRFPAATIRTMDFSMSHRYASDNRKVLNFYSARSLHRAEVLDAARLSTFKQQNSHNQYILIEILTPCWQSCQRKPAHWPVGGMMA